MRLFIDDTRDLADWKDKLPYLKIGYWEQAWTYQQAILYIRWCSLSQEEELEAISFDNDLGEKKEGYDILKYIEQLIHKKCMRIPWMVAHTSNPSALKKILLTIQSIERHFGKSPWSNEFCK